MKKKNADRDGELNKWKSINSEIHRIDRHLYDDVIFGQFHAITILRNVYNTLAK